MCVCVCWSVMCHAVCMCVCVPDVYVYGECM